jgi:thioredoxin-dependent peroxiredoxin
VADGPGVGDPAPDFSLDGVGPDGTPLTWKLSDHKGQKLVLAFYPGDFTPGCTRQLCSYRDNFEEFQGVDATILGISPQSVESHGKFVEKHGFPFPLLTDADKAVGTSYGIIGPLGYRRSVFVIDGAGVVRYKHVAALIGVTHKSTATLKKALEAI